MSGDQGLNMVEIATGDTTGDLTPAITEFHLITTLKKNALDRHKTRSYPFLLEPHPE